MAYLRHNGYCSPECEHYMSKETKQKIEDVIKMADNWIQNCHCGFKDKTSTWCEQYGCSSINELIEPLRKLINGDKTNNF